VLIPVLIHFVTLDSDFLTATFWQRPFDSVPVLIPVLIHFVTLDSDPLTATL
jgi:hypothetical protein